MASLELNFPDGAPPRLATLFTFTAPSESWVSVFAALWRACEPWPCRLCILTLPGSERRRLVEAQTVPIVTKLHFIRLMVMAGDPSMPVRTLKAGGLLRGIG